MDNKLRGRVQFVAALVQNADLRGFFTGRIDQGAQKAVCVPGLNCYSCPGALMSCPIGSLQAFLSARPVKVPYYVAGLLLFFGALLGRAVCGFLCPFGWIQELLHKIPFPRKKLGTFPGDRLLRRLKYLVLAGLVVLVGPEGECYHSAADCSGLIRRVRRVRLSETGGLPPCSRCGK